MEHESVRKLWLDYLATIGEDENITKKKYTAWYFCDNERDANHLLSLVLHGVKQATASLYIGYEHEKEEPPKTGDHSVITDWNGIAKCILETTQVDLVPFHLVTPEFAATEGEGDKSLEYWRGAHLAFFSREMAELGLVPSEDMLVVCEQFKVVHRSMEEF